MRRPLAVLLVLCVAAPATACLWDYDTLEMERQRFPGALELIVGKFKRHSPPFYEWRAADRREKIAAHAAGTAKLADADLARAYDDLAVALDKLGRHDEAITAIREKADRLPEAGRYETHANLGTFLVHAGRFDEGLTELRKALEINPDAHFGREQYQILLVEYLQEKRKPDGELPSPLDSSSRYAGSFPPFVDWLLKRQGLTTDRGVADPDAAAEVERASRGVLGMMRFGDYRSPVLLEVVGDLTLSGSNGGRDGFGQRLAARAYLRAADAAGSEAARAAYREMAASAVWNQIPERGTRERRIAGGDEISLASIEDQLAREVREADEWFKRVEKDERLWIAASPDPDRRYWEKYGPQDVRVGHDRLPSGQFAGRGLPTGVMAGLAVGVATMLFLTLRLIGWRRRRPNGYGAGDEGPRGDRSSEREA